MVEEKVIGIDLFAGAGGMSLGAKMAGVSISYAIEKDIYAAKTYEINHPSTKVINADIRNITTLSIHSKLPIILFGGAPCQGFSTSNRRTNSRTNPDNWLYKEFIRMLRTLSPDWVVFENVTGLIEMESGAFFKGVLSDFSDSGYECVYTILKATDLGIPQKRKRLFIIGSKNKTKLIITEKKIRLNILLETLLAICLDLKMVRPLINLDILNCLTMSMHYLCAAH